MIDNLSRSVLRRVAAQKNQPAPEFGPKCHDDLTAVLDENNKLRGLLAKGQGDCEYCQLPAKDIAKCRSGFPGCARMDDIINAPVIEAESVLLAIEQVLSTWKRKL